MATIRVCEEFQQGSYRLRKSPATLYPFEVHLNLFTLSHIFTWSLQLCYTAALVRLIYQIQQEDTSYSRWRIYVALLSDVFLQIPGAVVAFNILLALCTRNPTLPRPEYRLEGDEAPSVDVMITCCGEQVEILINTVAAAAAQSYPRGRFRVFVLDDGHDAELKSAVEMLDKRLRSQGAGAPVVYLSRTVPHGQPSYFKCGNLRYGMEESQGLGSGSELVAGLDADMIPEPDWLRTMVPHLLLQDTVAMAVCPQTYYNVPPDDPLGQKADFDAYFTVQELLNDRLGACMCTGTGYVAKRKAIADIGGWPLAFSGEDYMCSVLLTGAGWEIAFERRTLQKGLTPESLTAAMKQRMRWTDGGIEVHERLTAFLPTSTLASRMRLPIRIVNMGYVVRDYSPILTVLALLFLPFALMPTTTSTDSDIFQSIALKHRPYLVMTQKLFFVTHLAQVFHGYYTYYHLDPAVVANTSANGLWSSPYAAYRATIHLLHLLPLPLPKAPPSFAVCGAMLSPPSPSPSPFLRRFLSNPLLLLYSLYSLYVAIPLLHILLLRRGEFAFPNLALALLRVLAGVAKVLGVLASPPKRERGWAGYVVEDEGGVRRPRRKEGGRGAGIGGFDWVGLGVDGVVLWLCALG